MVSFRWEKGLFDNKDVKDLIFIPIIIFSSKMSRHTGRGIEWL